MGIESTTTVDFTTTVVDEWFDGDASANRPHVLTSVFVDDDSSIEADVDVNASEPAARSPLEAQ